MPLIKMSLMKYHIEMPLIQKPLLNAIDTNAIDGKYH
jgi:hypothetical protein